jgi:tRNA(Ile)-lysidine synthase
MSTHLHRRLLAAIRRARMFAPGNRVGVAVSGGGDSVALLLLLCDLRAELGITVAAVHLNHRLRGKESTSDERFVAELARSLGLECFIKRRNVAARARAAQANLEETAREHRYAFFQELLTRRALLDRVATAHTLDDQAETVLDRILRGTGIPGLAAIRPVRGAIVRPLLAARRQELRDFLKSRAQPWREDASNQDVSQMRARLRHKLLPELAANYSSAAAAHLSDLARLAQEDEEFWRALEDDCFHRLVRAHKGVFSIRASDLLMPLHLSLSAAESLAARDAAGGFTQQQALASRLVRRIFQALPGSRALGSRHVDQVIHLAASASGSGHRVELPGGIVASREFDQIEFRAEPARRKGLEKGAAEDAYEIEVVLPARGAADVTLPAMALRFSFKLIDCPALPRDTGNSLPVALDAARLRFPLVLRNWRPGDAYHPLGRRSSRKLKGMFLVNRVPLHLRALWPVLTCGGAIAWARGMPAAEEFAATKGSRRLLLIREAKI